MVPLLVLLVLLLSSQLQPLEPPLALPPFLVSKPIWAFHLLSIATLPLAGFQPLEPPLIELAKLWVS